MQLQYTPYVLPLLIATAVSTALATYVWRRRPAAGAASATLVAMTIAVRSLGYALELTSTGLAGKLFWAKFQFLGIAILPTAWLVLILQYTGQERWLTRRNVALLAIEPLVTLLLAWTNERHLLVYSGAKLDTSGRIPMLDLSFGVWSWFDLVYASFLLTLGVFLLIQALIRSPRLYRGQIGTLLVGMFVPAVAGLLSIAGIRPSHLDLTPFALTLACLAATWGLFRYRLLDIMPMARDAVVENINDGVIVLDGQDRIVDINSTAERIIGSPASGIIGKPAAQTFSNWPSLLERCRDVVETQEEIILDDGKAQRHYELHISLLHNQRGRPVGQLIVLHDITERRQTEEVLERRVRERTAELQAQYARLDAILHSTSDGIVVTNAGGNLIQANPVAQAWLTQTLSPEEAERLQKAVQSLATRAEEQPVELLELTGLDLELKAAPIRELGLEEEAAVVVIHDVTHLKAMDRMKACFVTNVSHQLRTPVTTIKLYAHLMQQQSEKWAEYLAPLTQEADHQAQLVENILQISRIDAGRLEMNPKPAALNTLTGATVANYQLLARERGLTLKHKPARPGPVALVDVEWMTQVLSNLVMNAILYTPEGGTISVSTGREKTDDRIWATATVADTGMGIPGEEIPHIFERFFRGEKPQQMQISGTGLGLAIVKETMELHGGRITVESHEGQGSAFTVWLPLVE